MANPVMQITLDPSLISTTDLDTVNMAVSISGISWENGSLPLDAGGAPDSSRIQNLSYPWRWGSGGQSFNRPTHMKVIWLDENNNILPDVPNAFLEIDFPVLSEFKDDGDLIVKHQEYIFNKKVFLENGTVSEKDLFVDVGKGEKQEVNVTDDGTSQGSVNGNTGFFAAAIGRLAQMVPPINQKLHLVFLVDNQPCPIPAGAKKFVIFPQDTNHWEGGLVNDSDIVNNGQYCMRYGSPMERRVFCPITEIEETLPQNGPIQLRDTESNFLGRVNLNISDVEDIIPELVSNVNAVFDLPTKLHSFLKANSVLLAAPNAKPFLWATLRDGLGFGYMPESDQNSMLSRVVRRHCDDKVGKLEELERADRIRYWKEYDDAFGKLKIRIDAFDLNLTKEAWENLIIDELPTMLGDDRLPIKNVLEKLKRTTTGISNDEWLASFELLLKELKQDDSLAHKILFLQWDRISNSGVGLLDLPSVPPDKENAKLKWLEEIFTNAGEIRLLQFEAITQKYKKNLLASIGNFQPADAKQISRDCITSLRDYANVRAAGQIFLPAVTDPFDAVTNPDAWNNFISSLDKYAGDAEAIISGRIEKTFSNPPAIQLRVDETEAKTSLDESDLNDEISGHIVLVRRASAITTSDFGVNGWRYLNWAKATSVKRTDAVPPAPLKLSYLLPAFPGESAGEKTAFLSYSNEKPSFIAGHDMFAPDRNVVDVDTPHAELRYSFDEVDTHKAYALWYGFNYEFAGYVALNSGVLPPELRNGSWNRPSEEPKPINVEGYSHLRRVPISKTRVEITQSGSGRGPLAAPKGLLPLAFELPAWKGNRALRDDNSIPLDVKEAMSVGEQSHYLLWDQQPGLTLKLKKPTTPIWNWYAWLGQAVSGVNREIAVTAFDREMKIRDDENGTQLDHLCDPAIENKLVVSVCVMFPKVKTLPDVVIDFGAAGVLDDPEKLLKVTVGTDTRVLPDGTISILPGDVVRMQIHCLVNQKYFKSGAGGEMRFHPWMKKNVRFGGETGFPESEQNYPGFYLGNPVEIWYEAAKKPAKRIDPTLSNELWKSLRMRSERDENGIESVVVCMDRTKDNYDEFAYLSRINVMHQVWNWNGRLDESEKFLKSTDGLDPVDGKTTEAMRWEAWSFSDRPDFSSMVSETNLSARTENAQPPEPIEISCKGPDLTASSIPQEIFRDRRPKETKALYYRFYVTAHWRYEKLGPLYTASYDSEKTLGSSNGRPLVNKWRRFIRKATRTERLPKPIVRFILPLTKSIDECNDENKITSASLLVVLEDRWFSEAGLAEQLEIGIPLRSATVYNPTTRTNDIVRYLNAGNDPIMTGYALGSVSNVNPGTDTYPRIDGKNGDDQLLVLPPMGPVGLTMDFAAQTPRLKGCGFIVEVPSLNKVEISTQSPDPQNPDKITATLQPWSFAEVAVRRTLRDKLCEPGLPPDHLASEWSAREWVQFLPSIDSFIPNGWRDQVRRKRNVEVTQGVAKDQIEIKETSMPVFDEIFEELNQRFLVVTEKVYDIGGRPCERYLATYEIKAGSNIFKINDKPEMKYAVGQEGYLRILFVRNQEQERKASPEVSIWERLFGESAKNTKDKVNFTTVQKDPSAALPMVSERVPFKIVKP